MNKFFSSKTASLEAALDYADKKIPVFPVIFYNTTKTFGSVCSFSEATTDKKAIKAWFLENPSALVAIPCGLASGIIALSVDKGTTFTAKTPCFTDLFGKKTYFFKLPEGENFGCGKTGGLEWKGDLGSVVLPAALEVVADGELEVLPDEIALKIKEVLAAEEEGQEADQEEEEETGLLPALPLECLPQKLRTVIEGVSKVFCVSPWLPFAAALRTASTAIGANAILDYKNGVPGHLWLCLVGEPSSGKSEICNFFNASIYREQKFYCDMYETAIEEYKNALQKYEADKALGLKEGREPQFKKPIQPTKTTLYVDDVTPESLIMILKDNPSGVLWDCDEIKTLLSSFGRYGGSGSGEAAKSRLLSMYSGKPVKLDRKGSESTIMIQKGWVSIFGTTQPSILPTLFTKEDAGSGFLQRFMFINSEQTPPTPESTRPELQHYSNDTADIFSEMLMQIKRLDPLDSESKPLSVKIDEIGIKKIGLFCDEIRNQAYYLSGEGQEGEEERARAGRWCEQLPRLILLLHAIEKCCNSGQISNCVDTKTVENAIKIFKSLQEHSKFAWNKIRGKKIKKAKKTDICSIVDKYIEKNGDIYELKYPEILKNGEKVVDALLKELGAAEASLSTRQALTKALESQGFTKKMYNKGTKFIIQKAVYEKNLNNSTIPLIEAKKSINSNDFFAEIKNGMIEDTAF